MVIILESDKLKGSIISEVSLFSIQG